MPTDAARELLVVEEPDPAVGDAAVPDAAVHAARSDQLVILAGGDVNLGRGLGQKLLGDDTYNPLGDLASVLDRADLRIVNLESPLSDQRGETQSPNVHLVFTGPPQGADALARAHIDVVSLANNHAWDYGKDGFFQTLDNLERAGVAYVGASRPKGAEYEPVVLHLKGWSIALFAVTQIWNQGPFDQHEAVGHVAWADVGKLEAELEAARKQYDLVLVSYHGGGEYVELPMQWTRAFVDATMKMGIDAVIGHHPHVPHGVGWYGQRPALYSLGNLVFEMHRDHPWTGTSFLARLTFTRGAAPLVEACPYTILGHRPMPFPAASKAARMRQFTEHLKRISLGLGGIEIDPPGADGCMALHPKSATKR